MSLQELIHEMDRSTAAPILVDDIQRFIVERGLCQDIAFIPADMDSALVKGFIRPFTYRNGVYGEPIFAANVYFAKSLNDCWRRYVCAKELLHLVTKSPENVVDTPEKLRGLMIGMTVDLPAAILDPERTSYLPVTCVADWIAEVLAIPVLVPPTLRKMAFEKFNEGKLSHHDAAQLFRIPRKFVPIVLSDFYEALIGSLLTSGCD